MGDAIGAVAINFYYAAHYIFFQRKTQKVNGNNGQNFFRLAIGFLVIAAQIAPKSQNIGCIFAFLQLY